MRNKKERKPINYVPGLGPITAVDAIVIAIACRFLITGPQLIFDPDNPLYDYLFKPYGGSVLFGFLLFTFGLGVVAAYARQRELAVRTPFLFLAGCAAGLLCMIVIVLLLISGVEPTTTIGSWLGKMWLCFYLSAEGRPPWFEYSKGKGTPDQPFPPVASV